MLGHTLSAEMTAANDDAVYLVERVNGSFIRVCVTYSSDLRGEEITREARVWAGRVGAKWAGYRFNVNQLTARVAQ